MKKIDFLKWRQRDRLLAYFVLGLSLLLLPNLLQAQNNSLAQLVEAKKVAGGDFSPINLLEIDGQNARRTDVQEWVSGETLLQIDAKNMTALMRSQPTSLTFTIPSKKGSMELELVQHDVVTDDFQLTIKENGKEKEVDYNTGVHYRGIIKGETQTMAAISIFDNKIIGGVFDGTKQYTLGPVDDREQGQNIQHIFYEAMDLKISHDFICHADDESTGNQLKTPKWPVLVFNPNKCFHMYFECAYQMYQDKGYSVVNTADYVVAIYNQAALIFQNESINTSISQLVVWTTLDPYRTSSSAVALSDFRSHLGSSFNGDLAHLLTTGSYGNGGRAYLDALCDKSRAHAYSNISASYYNNFPIYSWSVDVITHEIGHNLGSRHTHDCVWNGNNTAIDGCGPAVGYSGGNCATAPLPSAGTIMSYCYLVGGVGIDFNLGFGQQPGDLIRSKVYNASCLTTCNTCPTNLTINQTFTSGDVEDFETTTSITSAANIQNGANITFDAGYEVNFLPGFDAKDGCDFLAVIDGCGGSYKTGGEAPRIVLQEQEMTAISEVKCYPNPFSTTTTFSYTLNKAQTVSLAIFSPTGQEITRLLDHVQQSAGSHELYFDAHELPKGVYFYRFIGADGEHVEMGKLMLVD